MTEYPCGRGPDLPIEYAEFFKHREASLALGDLVLAIAASPEIRDNNPFPFVLSGAASSRSADKTAFGVGEIAGLMSGHIARSLPPEWGGPITNPEDVAAWATWAELPKLLAVLGRAAARAGAVSGDKMQTAADRFRAVAP